MSVDIEPCHKAYSGLNVIFLAAQFSTQLAVMTVSLA